jgi:hypothetical protein
MGISLTITGDNLYNLPDDDPETLLPDDLTISVATESSIVVEVNFDGVDFTLTVAGQFAYTDDVTGVGLGTASTRVAGTISALSSVVVDQDGDVVQSERTEYEPPVPWQPITTLRDTLESLRLEYAGNDQFVGDQTTPFSDEVSGYGGNDRFVMTYGNPFSEKFHGGDGIDTAVITSDRVHWTIEQGTVWDIFTRSMGAEGYRVTDTRHADSGEYGEQGHVLELTEVERIQFRDINVALDLGGAAGQTAKVLAAVFGKDALSIPGYVGVGLTLFDDGQTLESVAALALDFVGAQTNIDIVNILYSNLFGAMPTTSEAQPYIDALNAGALTRGSIGAAAAELTDDLDIIDLIGLAETGIEYL